LFYSAVTKRIGLHPLDEEYITMGMAAWGRNTWYQDMREHVIADEREIRLKQNFHTGMSTDFLVGSSNENIAAAGQLVAEDLINK
jgi:carbamoyltransferase